MTPRADFSIKDFFSLIKIIISLAVTFTAFTGFVIHEKSITFLLIPTLIGVFLLSAGASAFNHIMEANTDALMNRTKNRPIPNGRISLREATFLAITLSVAGFIILLFLVNSLCAFLGLFNLLWYNFVYTPLKKRTVWAVFIGTITGIIPFFMGISANNGNLLEPSYLFIALYMMIWQVPHFLILISIYGAEYEIAGLASATSKLSPERIVRISSLWIISSCLISMSLPIFGLLHSKSIAYSIIIFSIFIVWINIGYSFFCQKDNKRKILFALTNIMQAGFMAFLAIDSLLS